MFAMLAPYKLLIEFLAAAALLAAISWGIHSFLEHERDIGYQRAVVEYTAKALLAEQAARATEQRLAKQLEEATNASTNREKALVVAVAASAKSAGSLRDTISSLNNSLSSATLDASRKTAAAFGAVFGDCQEQFRAMGLAAQGHYNDSLMYQQAWPK